MSNNKDVNRSTETSPAKGTVSIPTPQTLLTDKRSEIDRLLLLLLAMDDDDDGAGGGFSW